MSQSEVERDNRCMIIGLRYMRVVEMNRDTSVRHCERVCIFAFLAYLCGYIIACKNVFSCIFKKLETVMSAKYPV